MHEITAIASWTALGSCKLVGKHAFSAGVSGETLATGLVRKYRRLSPCRSRTRRPRLTFNQLFFFLAVGLLVTACPVGFAVAPQSNTPAASGVRKSSSSLGDPASATPFISRKSPLIAKLAASTTAIVDGKPFRAALQDLADKANLTLWIDRRIDPGAIVSVGPVGPTVYAALGKIANSNDCVLMPIDSVVLVGRSEWVDATAASVLTIVAAKQQRDSERGAAERGEILQPLPRHLSTKNRMDIRWPDATTPTDALQIPLATLGLRADAARLPHDLWPQTDWRSIDVNVAIALILAQFDLGFDHAALPSELTTQPLDDSVRGLLRYDVGANRTDALATIRKVDSSSKTRRGSGSELDVIATATAHRAAIDQFLQSLATETQRKSTEFNLDQKNLKLNLVAVVAGEAFTQLAAASGRRCVITEAAQATCSQRVSLQVQQGSMRQIVDEIARQVHVKVTWTDGELQISDAN